MTNVSADIPEPLQPAATAALAWINETRDTEFELTGLVDYEAALAAGTDEPMELGLVLCDGEICLREQVRIEPRNEAFAVRGVAADDSIIPPHLDPPEGLRAGWLDEQLAQHRFVLLVFYRGFW